MPEHVGGRTFYSREESEALGFTPSPEELAHDRAIFDRFEAEKRARRAASPDPGSVDDLSPELREQLELRSAEGHAGTESEGSTLRDGKWYDAAGNIVYTQGPGGWYDNTGTLVYDLLGRKPGQTP